MPPPSSRIPSLLQPYVSLPSAGSLHLLTSILGASTNWLVIRYLCSALAGSDARKARPTAVGHELQPEAREEAVAVILVSFLRDWEFWKTESRRAGGLDLARLAQQNRLAFVDGLSHLFLPTDAGTASQPPTASPLPLRTGRAIAPRTAPQAPPTRPSAPASTPAAPASTFPLTSPTLSALTTTIQQAQTHLTAASPKRILLILDAPDYLLAAGDPHASDATTPTTLASAILALRAGVHATVLSLSADTPLVASAADAIAQGTNPSGAGSGSHTPLESAHAAFLVGQAHVADVCLSLRLLDTGFAADVSGVLRVTRGDNEGEEGEEGEEVQEVHEKEVLYYVGGDGSVRVFERGAGGANT
ncbi:hypothetical protein B0J12DRAFT_568486 [Macrophomina phaseolina]|uniref:Elongator complex protein 6 n=1 Tax=Macrophomina phaseolina TaxID=35725 RepID=A0ABQ8GJ26_9PEZI|nr:hypothetical protein B0J12DRAFT_568486 [Macrophomina phaseolina]